MPKKKTTSKRPIKKSTKKKRASKKAKRISFFGFLFKLAFIVFILGTVFLGGLYFYIDHRVKNFIAYGNNNESSQILSSESRLFKNRDYIALPHLSKILKNHNYHLVKRENLKPGDYNITKDRVNIYRRAGTYQDGNQIPAKIFNLTRNEDVISQNGQTITLEPTVLSNLNNKTIRTEESVPLKDFPTHVKDSLLVTEDVRFYQHFGVDILGILRAIVVNVSAGKLKQGGSTITQQLAKNTLFDSSRTLKRKAQEALAAISFERRLSKDQVLELYLNTVYLGQSGSLSINGFPAASKFFFGKSIEQISISEAAMLAGLIKAPSYYAPQKHPKRAAQRRDVILNSLLNEDRITKKQYDLAKAKKNQIIAKRSYRNKAPYFIQSIRKELSKKYNTQQLANVGVKVHTGIDTYLQSCAENAVSSGMEALKKKYPGLKNSSTAVGLVAIESYSGLVKAWVGGSNYQSSQLDHVEQTSRQIGSTVKPFVYLTALDPKLNQYKVASPITILTDKPIAVEQDNNADWTPKNYDGNFRGAVTLRYALEKSLNIPAVYVTQKVGPKTVARTLELFELKDKVLAVPSIALGTTETNLLKLTSAYAALANQGNKIKPRLYSTILNNAGDILHSSKIKEKNVANKAAVSVLTNILQGVMRRGTAARSQALGLKIPAAGKTGTTNDDRDSWFVGYTTGLAAGVWLGRDDNKPINLTGSSGALPIWTEFMKCSEPQITNDSFILEQGVISVKIDTRTGLKYRPSCGGNPIEEVFIAGTEPPYFCDENYRRPSRPEEINPVKKKEKSFLDLLFG